MTNNNTTFWNLIESHKISIPIIQRDYAQGREEEVKKREKFLNSILKHLINSDEKLHLDFVYGRVKDNTFYPIDGQQRLTTLFLLHWYFALKEDINIQQKLKLNQFVYDTRISSREFCQSLIKEEIKIPKIIGENLFIASIKNKFWYRDKWNSDPTVKAMLIMIQAIHNKFNDITSSTFSVFKLLTNDKPISFELLDLGAKGFELTDELYIKMNARGKQLTSFESFKANFIQLISIHFKDEKLNHPIKGEISYSGYFSYKIEKEWTDLFWAFRGDKKTIDDGFSNYFEFVTQMLFFKKNKGAKADDFKNNFSQYEDIYGENENLLFLFNSLDKLYDILNVNGEIDKKNINNFFNSITNNIQFFWNAYDGNSLFERIILNSKKDDARNKILFYSILYFLIDRKISKVDIQLNSYVRIIRNLIQATRQRNETKYNTNIRVNNFGSYWLLFKQLSSDNVYQKIQDQSLDNKASQISDDSLNNEVEKVELLLLNNQKISSSLLGLEEFDGFEGLIHQLKPKLNQTQLQEYLKDIKEIWDSSISSSLKIRALIACDFEGIYIKNCKMGEMWYFGKNHNWTTILTSIDNKVSSSIIKLLNKYSQIEGNTETRLNTIIDTWLKNNQNDSSWRSYFMKYPEFTSKFNYYAWRNEYEIRILGSESSSPLLAKHISPFVLAVCRRVNDNKICDTNDCNIQYSGNHPLTLKNGLTMTSTKKGWEIPKDPNINDLIISKYKLTFENANYVLKDTDKMDRIEIAVDFINAISKK